MNFIIIIIIMIMIIIIIIIIIINDFPGRISTHTKDWVMQ